MEKTYKIKGKYKYLLKRNQDFVFSEEQKKLSDFDSIVFEEIKQPGFLFWNRLAQAEFSNSQREAHFYFRLDIQNCDKIFFNKLQNNPDLLIQEIKKIVNND